MKCSRRGFLGALVGLGVPVAAPAISTSDPAPPGRWTEKDVIPKKGLAYSTRKAVYHDGGLVREHLTVHRPSKDDVATIDFHVGGVSHLRFFDIDDERARRLAMTESSCQHQVYVYKTFTSL